MCTGTLKTGYLQLSNTHNIEFHKDTRFIISQTKIFYLNSHQNLP